MSSRVLPGDPYAWGQRQLGPGSVEAQFAAVAGGDDEYDRLGWHTDATKSKSVDSAQRASKATHSLVLVLQAKFLHPPPNSLADRLPDNVVRILVVRCVK